MAGFCSHELQILIKYVPQAKKLLKFHWKLTHFIVQMLMDLFDFNAPISGNNRENYDFHGEGGKIGGREGLP